MSNNGPYYAIGRYLGEITDQGLTKAQTGTVQIAIRFKVLEGTTPARQLDAQYERTAFLAVTEKTMEYLVPKLHSLGYTRDSIRFIDLTSPECHDLRNQKAEFFCKHENSQDGQLIEKWDVAMSQSTPLELKPPDPKDLRKLDALFGAQLKKSGASKPKPTPPVQQPGYSDQPSDDDVPF